MDEAWLHAILVAQRLQQTVDMHRRARTALHREAERLVEHHEILILIERDRLEESRIGRRSALARPACHRPRVGSRRSANDADSLAGRLANLARDLAAAKPVILGIADAASPRGQFLRPLQRRNADDLPRLDPGFSFRAGGSDPDLPGAQQFLEMPEGQIRKVRLEPAIKPHPGFIFFHFARGNAAHVLYPCAKF